MTPLYDLDWEGYINNEWIYIGLLLWTSMMSFAGGFIIGWIWGLTI